MSYVRYLSGAPVFPESFTANEWEILKAQYQVGDYLMECCNTPAIPKTSINGVQFFSHQSDECSTAPETIWHINTKSEIYRILIEMGYQAVLEKPFNFQSSKFQPDIYFESNGRKIAIEVQHSHQTLKTYLDRQNKYLRNGFECYWIIYHPCFKRLNKAVGKHIIKENGNKWPGDGKSLLPFIPTLPTSLYLTHGEPPYHVFNGGKTQYTLSEWLTAIANDKFKFIDSLWKIVN